jgi:glycosyltransferase involved in cell wall biosynthesis
VRLHLPALPGQPVGGPDARSTCAFTEKIRKFPAMLQPLGYEVIIYGPESHDHQGTHVGCYEDIDPPAFTAEEWGWFNQVAAREIRKRMEPGDILGIMGGTAQKFVADLLPELLPVEYGIGYAGSWAPYRVFESWAWYHQTLGGQGVVDEDGRFYWSVIPAYFEPERFPDNAGGDYILYLGRMTQRKGVEIVEKVAQECDMPVIFAGEGEWVSQITYEKAECVGKVGVEERAELLANAHCLMYPTVYVEPFGCSQTEAALCGVPTLTSPFGAYSDRERVRHGVDGWRCATIGEFVWGVQNAGSLDRAEIRRHAQKTYSLEAIAPLYDHYFQHLQTLSGDGFYNATPKAPNWF